MGLRAPPQDVKIWHKILLGYLLVAVLISLSGVPTSYYYGRILEAFRSMKDVDLVTIDTLEQMEKTLLEMDSSLRYYQITRSSEAERGYQDEKRQWLTMREQLTSLLGDETDPRLLQDLDI